LCIATGVYRATMKGPDNSQHGRGGSNNRRIKENF
jgi:hypothetical protein